MSHFVPAGYLTPTAALDRVVELMQGDDAGPLLTEKETAILRDLRAILYAATHPKPGPIVPVPKAGDGGRSTSAVTYIDRTPDKPVEDKPPRPDVTPEEWKDLLRKEALFNEQQDKASHAARECLQQLLYVGRVPSKIITDQGALIETPKHVWGGDQWYEAFRSNRIKFAPRLGVTVSGRPLIPRDALEAAFNPDEPVKEEPQPKPDLPRRKTKSSPVRARGRRCVASPP